MTEEILKSLQLQQQGNAFSADMALFTKFGNYIKGGNTFIKEWPRFKLSKGKTIFECQDLNLLIDALSKIYEKTIDVQITVDLLKKYIKISEAPAKPNQSSNAAPAQTKDAAKQTQNQAQTNIKSNGNGINNQQTQQPKREQVEQRPAEPVQQSAPPKRVRKIQKAPEPIVLDQAQTTVPDIPYVIENGVLKLLNKEISDQLKVQLSKVLGVSPSMGFSSVRFDLKQ